MTFSRVALLGSVAALTAGGAALAAPAPDDGSTIAELIVTATRREESLQSIPVSVAVVTADAIQASGSASFSDVGFSAANVMFNSAVNLSGFRGVSIRGVQGRTGIYVDDVLIGNNASANVSVSDVERVEILRGPQGTTFGRNTLAGAINTLTRKPTFDWTGAFSAAYGEDNRQNVTALLSGPILDDRLAFKVSGFMLKHDGYETDAQGRETMTEDSYGFRGGLLWRAAPSLRFLLSGDYQKDDPVVNAYHLADPATGAYAENTIATSFPNENRRENYGVSLRAEAELGEIDIVAISAARRTRSDFHLDYDFLPQNMFYEKGARTVEEFSQELRASGGGERIEWLGGLYFYSQQYVDRNHSFLGPDYSGAATGGRTLAQLGLPGAVSPQYLERDSDSLAVFGSLDVRLTSQLKLVVGGRYARDTNAESTFTGNLTSRLVIGTLTPPAFPVISYPKIVSHRFTPSASLFYELNETTNLYATVGTGYQTGGFNSSACNGSTTVANCQYLPETLTSYEAGYKGQLFERRLLINVAAYLLDYKNLQRSQRFFYTTAAGATVQVDTTTNAAKASGQGVEVEFQARPTQALTFDGSFGYQKMTYDEYTNAPVRVDATGAPQLRDLSGADLPYAPKFTASLAANYTGDYVLGTYRLRAEVQHRDKYRNADGPFDLYRIAAQTNLNLTAATTLANGVTVAVKARNVLDKRYVIDQSYDAGFTGKFYVARSEPRTVWVEVSYDF